MRFRWFLPAAAMALSLNPTLATADVDPRAESERKIKVAQVIDVLGPELAGDSTSLYSGSTSFQATDVSLPGNNQLAVAVGRSYAVQLNSNEASNGSGVVPFLRAFGDWDLDIPYIGGVYSNQLGWEIHSTTPQRRCSVLDQARIDGSAATGGPRNYPVDYPKWWASEFWHGIDMNIPGQGRQSLLVANQPGIAKPTQGGPYHWTTKADWWLSCLPGTSNSQTGEAFVAISPAGEKYTFNHMSSRYVSKLVDMFCPFQGLTSPQAPSGKRHTLPVRDGRGPPSILAGDCEIRNLVRREFFLLPTRVEDRFGNWVAYTYSTDAFARLLGITASDGRQVSLTYNAQGFVSSISDGSQSWTYQYSEGRLARVILPDGSSWQYGFSGLKYIGSLALSCEEIGEPEFCYAPPVTSSTASGYVVHPSGGRADFSFTTHFKPSSGVESAAAYPVGLVSKSISGPGLNDATWTYSYSPTRDEFLAGCRSAAGCPGQVTVDAVAPDGGVVRTAFGIVPGLNQGMQLSEQAGKLVNGVPVFLKTSTTEYVAPNGGDGFAVLKGTHPMSQGDVISSDEVFYSERRLPVRKRVTTVQGVAFSWQATAFDGNARPIRVNRFSSLGSSRTEGTSYYDDSARWVMGQVATLSDATSGKVISRTDFDPGSALPIRSFSFGLLKQSMSYNADGSLARIVDGLNNATTIGNWHRGVPRTIVYPDGTGEQATVNQSGTVASSTDELGSSMNYGYDPMGRLSSLAYPIGDSTAWNGTARGFSAVGASEYGLPPGHWRQTTRTGNAQTTTFYDGRWQPVLTLTEGLGDVSSRSYSVKRFDDSGRETFVSYPVATISHVGNPLPGVATTYDPLGRAIRITRDSELGALTSSTEYLDGFRTRSTNPRGFSTTTSYQVFDVPDTSLPVLIESPEGVTTTILRDGFGKPKQVTRSGN